MPDLSICGGSRWWVGNRRNIPALGDRWNPQPTSFKPITSHFLMSKPRRFQSICLKKGGIQELK